MANVIFKKAEIGVIERLANRVKTVGGNIIYFGKYKPKSDSDILDLLIEQGEQILLVYSSHEDLVLISNGTISYNIVRELRLDDYLKNYLKNSRIRLENFLMDEYGALLFFNYNKQIDYSKLDLSYLQSVPDVVLTEGDTELKNWYTALANKIISYKSYSSSDEYRLPFVKAFNYENNYIYKFTGKHHLVDNVYPSNRNGRLLVYNTPDNTGEGTPAIDNTTKSITFTIQNTDITADSIYMNLAIQRIYVEGTIKRLEIDIKSPMANKNIKKHVKVIYRLLIDSVYTECKDLIIKLPNDAVGCELYTINNTIDALENISIYTENNEECEVLDSTLNSKINDATWFSLCGSQIPYKAYKQFIHGKNKPSIIDSLIRTKKREQPLM